MSAADHGPAVTDDEVLAVIASTEGEQFEPGTVADELPISAGVPPARLGELEERGPLASE